jgi:adenylyltransferase/sulfurtransferase
MHPTFPFLSYESQTKLEVLCGRDAVQIRPASPVAYSLDELSKRLKTFGKVQKNPFLISCQMENVRVVIFKDGRVMIHGIQEIEKAKNIYYRLLG